MSKLLRYPIRPLEHSISTDYPSIFTQPGFSPWVLNGRIAQGSFQKRWGYTLDRTIGSKVYGIILYQKVNATRFTIYLTENDVCCKKTAAGETWSYITDTYTVGSVGSLTTGNTIVEFDGAGGVGETHLVNAGITAGDQFIIDADHTAHGGANVELNPHWATILSRTDLNTMVLDSAYTGSATSGTFKIRRVHHVPKDERWSWAVVNDILCLCNGTDDILMWDGADYTEVIDGTNARMARYCTEYANRLFIADCATSGGVREPLTIKWSGEGDPTAWDPGVDPTSGEADLMETDDFITGLGKVGGYLIVYKRSSLNIYSRTGESTSPITKVSDRSGIGMVAPYSLVQYAGTNFFIGRRNFYYINGDQAEAFGDKIKDKFFDIVGDTEVIRVWGGVNTLRNDIFWVANTSGGPYSFVFDIEKKEWSVDQTAHNMFSFGTGAV